MKKITNLLCSSLLLMLAASCKKEKTTTIPEVTSPAAQPTMAWHKNWGGSSQDFAQGIAKTTDGGSVTVGTTNSKDGDVTDFKDVSDVCIIKYNASGEKQWQKVYGGPGLDEGLAIVQAADGGFVIAGSCGETGGDVSVNKGGLDFWILKTDANGNKIWQYSYGGSATDLPRAIATSPDGGFVVAGLSSSDNGNVSTNKGMFDAWVIKLNQQGQLQWQHSYGSSASDYATGVLVNTDGTIMLSCTIGDGDGDVMNHKGADDYWLLKLNTTGSIIWQKTFGGSDAEYCTGITAAGDGGYILSGSASSSNGDVTGLKGINDIWLVKVNSNGQLIFQKTYGGSRSEVAFAASATPDGGVFVAGYTNSADGDLVRNRGGFDSWLLRIDNDGKIRWQLSNGGSLDDKIYALTAIDNQNCVAAGVSNSEDIDLTGKNKGDTDIWTIKYSFQ